MKVELSKREIECILEIMEYGITFLITHGSGKVIKNDFGEDDKRKKVKINELEGRLKELIK